jgi:subtilase family serine protease
MKGIVKPMRRLRIQSVLGLFFLVIVACNPNPPASESSPPSPLVQSTSESDHPSQPDLNINLLYLEMEGRQGNCVNAYSPYGIRVQIKNIGSANTGSFFVDLNGIRQEVSNGLLVGQSIELHFAGTIPSGQYEATADVTNQVVESREDNNTYSFRAPTPTPPPLCVATTTPTP